MIFQISKQKNVAINNLSAHFHKSIDLNTDFYPDVWPAEHIFFMLLKYCNAIDPDMNSRPIENFVARRNTDRTLRSDIPRGDLPVDRGYDPVIADMPIMRCSTRGI
jgi:hypothetical protein